LADEIAHSLVEGCRTGSGSANSSTSLAMKEARRLVETAGLFQFNARILTYINSYSVFIDNIQAV
jgi:hypothetical protein